MDEGSVTSLCTFELTKRLSALLIDCKVNICTNNAVTPVIRKTTSVCIQGVGELIIFEVSQVLVQKKIIAQAYRTIRYVKITVIWQT